MQVRHKWIFHGSASVIAFMMAFVTLFFLQRSSWWFSVATGSCPPCDGGSICAPCTGIPHLISLPIVWASFSVIAVLFTIGFFLNRRITSDSHFLTWTFFYLTLFLFISLLELLLTAFVVVFANQA